MKNKYLAYRIQDFLQPPEQLIIVVNRLGYDLTEIGVPYPRI